MRFKSFSEDDAWRLGCAMRELAVARKLPLVIDIRVSGRQLFYCALEGTHADNPHWVRRKSNVTLRVFKSSYRFGRELLEKGESVSAALGLDPHGIRAAWREFSDLSRRHRLRRRHHRVGHSAARRSWFRGRGAVRIPGRSRMTN